MDFRSLHNFTVVAEELHFGRAAKRLNIVQPALSRQVQKIEQYLDLQLFQRTNRQVKLTAAGAVFLEEARALLLALDTAAASARRAAEGKTGWVSIGFIGATTLGLLPRIMQTFRERAPEVEISLADLSTFEQLQRLHQKRIHIGFLRGPMPPDCPDLKFETVAREPLALAIPKVHPLAKNKRIKTRSLVNIPFVLYPRDLMSPWEILLRNICEKAGFVPNIVQRAIQVQTAIVLVAAGIGVTLVPASVEDFQQKGVVYRRLDDLSVAELLVAYRADETSPAVLSFLDTVRRVVRGSESSGRRDP